MHPKRLLAREAPGAVLLVLVAACAGREASSAPRVDGGEPRDSSGDPSLAPPSDGGSSSGSDAPESVPLPDCGSPPADAEGGATPLAPLDGRCDLTPRLLVSASTYPTPTGAGPVDVGVGVLTATGSGLYYAVYVVQTSCQGCAFLPGNVMRIPLGGGQPASIASGYLFGQPVLTATSLLFLALSTPPASDSDAILSVPLTGGPVRTLFTLPSSDGFANGLATDGTFAYFGDQQGLEAIPIASDSGAPAMTTIVPGALTDGIGVFGQRLLFTLPQGGIESVLLPPAANSPVTTLGNTGPAPVDLQPCGSVACWLDEQNGTLEEMSPQGGTITRIPLTSGFGSANAFAFDGTDFYVMGGDPKTNLLARIPGAGGCPVIIATMSTSNSSAAAVDDECIYWANGAGIYSVAKSAHGPFVQ